MSSFTRRLQRAHSPKRAKPSTSPHFGTQLGVSNPKAADRVARLAREARHGSR